MKKTNDNKINLDDEVIIGVNTKQPKNTNKPKVKKNKFRIVKWLILLAIFIVAGIYLMLSPLFNVTEIQVINNNKLTGEEIESLSRIEKGTNTFKLSMKQIQNNVKENAYIESVKAQRSLPSTITITVKERVPRYMLEFANSYVYVDQQGYILEISEQKLEIPFLIGIQTNVESIEVGSRLDVEDLQKLDVVNEIFDIATSNEIIHLITRIDIQDEKNYTLYLDGEQKIAYLGDGSDLNIKILYIKTIVEKEKGVEGEIFLNIDINEKNVVFRQKVST